MDALKDLLTPSECAIVFVDQQAGLAFAVQSADRQVLLNNSIALAKTATAFAIPVVASTSASKVYSGPIMPPLQAALPSVEPYERRNMNVWEDEAARAAIEALSRRRLLISGLLTEGCVSLLALSALAAGYDVFVVADACGGATTAGHELALQRMMAKGAQVTSWLQVLLELQRDWTRHETYDQARAIVEANGGGYGIGLAYSKSMVHPPATPAS